MVWGSLKASLAAGEQPAPPLGACLGERTHQPQPYRDPLAPACSVYSLGTQGSQPRDWHSLGCAPAPGSVSAERAPGTTWPRGGGCAGRAIPRGLAEPSQRGRQREQPGAQNLTEAERRESEQVGPGCGPGRGAHGHISCRDPEVAPWGGEASLCRPK